MEGQDWITVKEAAKRLRITADECRKWIYAGVLPAMKVKGRWQIQPDTLAFAVQHAQELEIASNWWHTLEDVETKLTIILEGMVNDGGFDVLMRPWPPHVQDNFVKKLQDIAANMQGLAARAQAARDLITI